MRELTDRQYWDSVYEAEAGVPLHPPEAAPGAPPAGRRVKRLIKKLLGGTILDAAQSYAEYRLWDVIYRTHMPALAGADVLEIGSAPGTHLVQLRDAFGIVPYGIDRSDRGVEIHRKVFAAHQIDLRNVIHADVLSDEVRQRYGGYFDVVLSRGFVEHFTDPSAVIARHLELLKPGGHLLVSIPNLRGVNYVLARFFNRPVLAMHNIGIMRRHAFSALFDPARLSPRFCGYYGTFDFGLFNTQPGAPQRHVLALCRKLQLGLNVAFRSLLGERGAESRFSSPYLLYVGVKKR